MACPRAAFDEDSTKSLSDEISPLFLLTIAKQLGLLLHSNSIRTIRSNQDLIEHSRSTRNERRVPDKIARTRRPAQELHGRGVEYFVLPNTVEGRARPRGGNRTRGVNYNPRLIISIDRFISPRGRRTNSRLTAGKTAPRRGTVCIHSVSNDKKSRFPTARQRNALNHVRLCTNGTQLRPAKSIGNRIEPFPVLVGRPRVSARSSAPVAREICLIIRSPLRNNCRFAR